MFLSCCTLPAAGDSVTVVDDLHRAVVLRAPAVRIVSLAPSITETLFALGAGESVVGVTDYCNYPEAAKGKQRVGGMVNPNLETIVSLKPNLILVSMEGNLSEDFASLQSVGVPLFVTNPRSLDGIFKSITDIGLLTGTQAQAASLVAFMSAVRDSIVAGASGPRTSVLLVVSSHPLMVVGGGTFLSELLELAGGRNLAGNAAGSYPVYSRESVVVGNPEVIITLSGTGMKADNLREMYPEWHRIDAVVNRRVFSVDADMLARPGPRAVEGLKLLFHLLHQ